MTGIYVHIWLLLNYVNVGKYTITWILWVIKPLLTSRFLMLIYRYMFGMILLHREFLVNAEIFTMFFKDTIMNGETLEGLGM